MQTALLIFIVLFAAAIGFFLGLFLLSLDSPLLQKLFQKEPSEESLPAQENSEPNTPDIGSARVNKPSPDSRLILQIWKEEGKPPVYDLAGKYIPKEELPKEILNLITVPESAPSTPSPTPEPTVPEQPTATEPPTQVDQEVEEEGEAEVRMLSVIDEVNDILQKKLHGSPLAGKGIHLMENHNKEIRFWVGLNSYNDVDEIPDEAIRQIIDEAVREWEQNRS